MLNWPFRSNADGLVHVEGWNTLNTAISVTRVGRSHAALKIYLSVHASRTAYMCIEGEKEFATILSA